MDEQEAVVVDRALKQLSAPALERSKSARRVQRVLVSAQESGKLDTDDLRRATVDLLEEVDVPSYFAKGGDPSDTDGVESGLGLLFLLVLLTILAALAQDTDLGALIEELIQQLLASLRGG